MATVLEHTRRKLDVDTVYHLLETGRIGPEERVELVDGELSTMPAIGTRICSVTSRLVERLIRPTDPERVFPLSCPTSRPNAPHPIGVGATPGSRPSLQSASNSERRAVTPGFDIAFTPRPFSQRSGSRSRMRIE